MQGMDALGMALGDTENLISAFSRRLLSLFVDPLNVMRSAAG
jgi:hypothetical protein